MKATFKNSVDVLVKAYMNGSLVHGNCYACAVGNLVACGIGTKLVRRADIFNHINFKWDNDEDYPGYVNGNSPAGWGAVFSTDRVDGRKRQRRNTSVLNTSQRARRHIESTGYTWQELARIELAFEGVNMRSKDRMFNGLMAVVDVLADIHGVDLSVKEQAVGRFAEVHATK